MRCGRMFAICHGEETEESRMSGGSTRSKTYEVFIPSPEDYMREEAFTWHITTRNFFAFLFNKPLVGAHLGKAFVDLHDRLRLFRAEHGDIQKDMSAYLGNVGYLNFGHHADYALAVLYYAEHLQSRELWIDAFCHCVGMNDIVCASSEFEVGDLADCHMSTDKFPRLSRRRPKSL